MLLTATMSQPTPMYIVAKSDEEATEPNAIDFRPKATRHHACFARRKSVAAEQYDPEVDDDGKKEGGDDDGNEDGDYRKTIHAKTDAQRSRLRETVSQILVFRSLEPEQLNDVIDAMFERRVGRDENVIRQGDDGDNFYVIEDGVYDVTVTDDAGSAPGDGDGGAQRNVHRFDGEGSFGELALMYNVPRSATVTARTSGTLWAMDRKSFRTIVLKSAYRKRKRYEELLESVPMLRSLDSYERMNLADALTSAIFQDGDCIIRQGAEADGMYFVEDGEVRIVMSKDGAGGGGGGGAGAQTEMEVARMKAGSYFGEMALVENSPRSASVFAVGRTRAAFLERGCFERLLGPCLEIMKRNIDSYKKKNNS